MMTIPKKPISIALGAAFVLTGAVAQASVFQTSDLAAGYMVAAADAPASAPAETVPPTPQKQNKKTSELKCGEQKPAKTKADAAADAKHAEGKCGEGRCGQMKKK